MELPLSCPGGTGPRCLHRHRRGGDTVLGTCSDSERSPRPGTDLTHRSTAGSGAEASRQSPRCAVCGVPEEGTSGKWPWLSCRGCLCTWGPLSRAGRRGRHCLPEKPGPSQGSWARGLCRPERGEGRDYLDARVLEGEHAGYGQYLHQTGPR